MSLDSVDKSTDLKVPNADPSIEKQVRIRSNKVLPQLFKGCIKVEIN